MAAALERGSNGALAPFLCQERAADGQSPSTHMDMVWVRGNAARTSARHPNGDPLRWVGRCRKRMPAVVGVEKSSDWHDP